MSEQAVQNSAAKPFNWRDYVILDQKSLLPEESEMLTRVLDDISAFHGKEGEALIRQAAALDPNGKVTIKATRDGSNSGTLGETGAPIGIDFDQARSIFAQDGDASVHMSLTSIVVHELYHKADPMVKPKLILETILTPLCKEHGIENIPAVVAEVLRLQSGPKNWELEGAERTQYIVELREKGYAHLADTLEKIPASEFAKIHNDDNYPTALEGKNGVAKWENDATAYTDAIMQKNYGASEPQRKDYGNFYSDTPLLEPVIPKRSDFPFETQEFKAEPLPVDPSELTVLPPTVKNDATQYPIPTAHGRNYGDMLAGIKLSGFAGTKNDAEAPAHDAATSSAGVSYSGKQFQPQVSVPAR